MRAEAVEAKRAVARVKIADNFMTAEKGKDGLGGGQVVLVALPPAPLHLLYTSNSRLSSLGPRYAHGRGSSTHVGVVLCSWTEVVTAQRESLPASTYPRSRH